ncbi:MAG: hypothetical protein AB7F59_09255 [Bdellovibrionales bacterium]
MKHVLVGFLATTILAMHANANDPDKNNSHPYIVKSASNTVKKFGGSDRGGGKPKDEGIGVWYTQKAQSIAHDMQQSLNKKLINAVDKNDFKKAEEALLEGAQIDSAYRDYVGIKFFKWKDEWEVTPSPLWVAIQNENTEMVEFLIQQGANVNAKQWVANWSPYSIPPKTSRASDYTNQYYSVTTPLLLAFNIAQYSPSPKPAHFDIIKLLSAAGADPTIKAVQHSYFKGGLTHKGARLQPRMKAREIPSNFFTCKTPLIEALVNPNPNISQEFLDDLFAKAALECDDERMLEVLKQKGARLPKHGFYLVDVLMNYVTSYAHQKHKVWNDQPQRILARIELLQKWGLSVGSDLNPLLHTAANLGKPGFVEFWISKGANTKSLGQSRASFSSGYGSIKDLNHEYRPDRYKGFHTLLFNALFSREEWGNKAFCTGDQARLQTIQYLVSAGANLNATNCHATCFYLDGCEKQALSPLSTVLSLKEAFFCKDSSYLNEAEQLLRSHGAIEKTEPCIK